MEERVLIHRASIQSIKFSLCSPCYNRNFDKTCMEQIKFGTSIIVVNSSCTKCFVCQGFFSTILPLILSNIRNELANFGDQTRTVDIGTKLPYKFIENEDYIRSMFQIRGKSSIKTQINQEIRDKIRSDFNIEIRYSVPDCKFEITVHDDLQYSVNTIYKEHFFIGKYKKLIRGIPQRLNPNPKCVQSESENGEYNSCSDSIESYIEEILTLEHKAEKIKIIWTGSEDKNSLVMGHGRPFLVKANMSSQNVDTKKIYQRNGIEISFQGVQSHCFEKLRTYRQEVDLVILAKDKIDSPAELETVIANFAGEVRFRINNKMMIKRIYRSSLIGVKPGNQFDIRLVLDNGIPIKQLIGGQDPIEPSLTQYLRVPCECIYFDIVDVF